MKKSLRLTLIIILLFAIISEGKSFSQNIDIRLLRAFNSAETLRSDGFFRFISNSDPYIVIALPASVAVAGFLKHDDDLIRNGCVGLAATAVCGGITLVLKYSINRDRPFVTYPDIKKKSIAGTPSFPSGHATVAFATATSLSLAFPKWYVIAPSYLWAGTVAYSRMHLGVHYPSDILAGIIVGAGSSFLCYKAQKWFNK